MSQTTGHIHSGKTVERGGRYDRFLSFLRAHPGATTREIMMGANVCAVSAIVSELRHMGYRIICDACGVDDSGARIYRYHLLRIDNPAPPERVAAIGVCHPAGMDRPAEEGH